MEHVQQGAFGAVPRLTLVGCPVDEGDHAAYGDVLWSGRVPALDRALPIGVEDDSDLFGGEKSAARLPTAPSGFLRRRGAAHRRPHRRRWLLQEARKDLEVVEVPLLTMMGDDRLTQRRVEHI